MFKSGDSHQHGIHKCHLASVCYLFDVEDKVFLHQFPFELNEAEASLISTNVDDKDVSVSSIYGYASGTGLVRGLSLPSEVWYNTTSKYILKIRKILHSEDCERGSDSIDNELEKGVYCGLMMSELKDDFPVHTSPILVETEHGLGPEQMYDKPTGPESTVSPSLVGLSIAESLPVGGVDAPAEETVNVRIDTSELISNVMNTVSLMSSDMASLVSPDMASFVSPKLPIVSFESVSENQQYVPVLGIPPSGKVLVCGRRREMEDMAAIVPSFLSFGRDEAQPGKNVNLDLHFYGIFDGHGGSQASTYCMERLHLVIAEELSRVNAIGVPGDGVADVSDMEWEDVMKAAFLRMDKEVGGVCPNAVCKEDDDGLDSGCRCCEDAIAPENAGTTAVVAVVGPDKIVIANCGDSRAVLARGSQAIPLSRDHKPELEDEWRRIEAAGGRVICWDGYRVGGLLALSRAIGDRYLKRYVISEPEITCIQRSEDDECLILASDGLWDVVSNEFACQVARKSLPSLRKKYASRVCAPGEDAASAAVAALLVKLAYGRGSKDNISVVVVDLKFSEMNYQR